jgi:hypothetical protein
LPYFAIEGLSFAQRSSLQHFIHCSHVVSATLLLKGGYLFASLFDKIRLWLLFMCI